MSKTPRLLKVRLFSRQINPSLPENTNVFTPAYAIWIEQKKKLKYSCKYLNSKCFSFLSVGTRARSLVKLTTASKGREMRNNHSLSPSPEYCEGCKYSLLLSSTYACLPVRLFFLVMASRRGGGGLWELGVPHHPYTRRSISTAADTDTRFVASHDIIRDCCCTAVLVGCFGEPALC